MGYKHLAPTPCLEAGCKNYATYQGRCNDHKKVWVGSYRRLDLPSDWQTRRQIVFNRDNYTCHICGSNNPKADSIDHIDQSKSTDHSLENLAPIHTNVAPYCHRLKTQQEAERARNQNRTKY